ncbi:MAG: hypothetical protein ACI8XO_004450 [Verrucomicrobiales bacterium]|jgi:hypothetical protein
MFRRLRPDFKPSNSGQDTVSGRFHGLEVTLGALRLAPPKTLVARSLSDLDDSSKMF